MKSEEQWRAQLTPEQFHITRQKGTERAFSGEYYNLKDDGIYACVCCGQELFSSETKFDSGTGWPSFWAPIADENVKIESDVSAGMRVPHPLEERVGDGLVGQMTHPTGGR